MMCYNYNGEFKCRIQSYLIKKKNQINDMKNIKISKSYMNPYSTHIVMGQVKLTWKRKATQELF